MSKMVFRISRIFHLLPWLAIITNVGGNDVSRFLNNGHDDKVRVRHLRHHGTSEHRHCACKGGNTPQRVTFMAFDVTKTERWAPTSQEREGDAADRVAAAQHTFQSAMAQTRRPVCNNSISMYCTHVQDEVASLRR
jgi:hypothetical protein